MMNKSKYKSDYIEGQMNLSQLLLARSVKQFSPGFCDRAERGERQVAGALMNKCVVVVKILEGKTVSLDYI